MNDDARNNATKQPASLKNEATPDTAVFAGAAPPPTYSAAASSTIVPDAHIQPSGQKQHANPFSAVNMKRMANKYKKFTTPATDTPTAASVGASSRSPGLTVFNSPYLLRNRNFPTSSISTKNTPNKTKRQIMIKLFYTTLLYPKRFPLFPQSLPPDPLSCQSPTPHIHREITIFVPPLPPPNKQKRQ